MISTNNSEYSRLDFLLFCQLLYLLVVEIWIIALWEGNSTNWHVPCPEVSNTCKREYKLSQPKDDKLIFPPINIEATNRTCSNSYSCKAKESLPPNIRFTNIMQQSWQEDSSTGIQHNWLQITKQILCKPFVTTSTTIPNRL